MQGTRLWFQAQGNGGDKANEGDVDYSSLVTTALDPENLPSIHQLLSQRDPSWYQEFVVEPLGQEFVDSNFLKVQTIEQLEGQLDPAPTADSDSSIPATLASNSSEVKAAIGEESPKTIISSTPLSKSTMGKGDDDLSAKASQPSEAHQSSPGAQEIPYSTENALSQLKADVVTDMESPNMLSNKETTETSPAELNAQPATTTGVEQPASTSSEMSSPGQPVEAPITNTGSAATSVPTESLDSNSSTAVPYSKSSESFQSNIGAVSPGDVSVDGKTRIPSKDSEEPKDVKRNAQQPLNEALEAVSETKAAEDDQRLVVFGIDQKTIPLSNLTKKLGYSEEDILSLQSDVLSVIINDKIQRPRLGLPSQWKVSGGSARQEVRIVNNLDDVVLPQPRWESDKKKSVKRSNDSGTDSPVPRRSPVADSGPTGQDNSVRTRRRPTPSQPRGSTGLLDRRGRQLADGPRRQPSRPSRRDSKGTKKVYNVRSNLPDSTVMRQRRPPKRQSNGAAKRRKIDDPPPPAKLFTKVQVWPDMSTFRDLLRNEAELRLRILGDNWSSSIQQEGEWRMGLYKNWLWALNNGVGEDPIVPPSRYDRARRKDFK